MEENLEPTLVWLQERLLLDGAGLTTLIKTHPSFLGFSLEGHEEKLAWLQKRLLLDDKNLSKVVQSYPSILGCIIVNNLEPKLAWLQERLALDDKSLSKLTQKLPAVLGCSIDKSLSKPVKATPSVLCLSIDNNLEPKLTWLQGKLSLDDKSLSELVQKQPPLLGCNIATNLEPTIKFFEDCVGSKKVAIQFIANNPHLLTYSLENRLKPRLVECQEAGISIDTGTIQRIAQNTELRWSNSMTFQKSKLLKEQPRG
jgi:ferric-dicitrate binding protein FerR (iron transport regulator)